MTEENPLKAELMRKILIAELRSLGMTIPGPNGLGSLQLPSQEQWEEMQRRRAAQKAKDK